ncbi:transcription factor bHLH51-like [Oryza brachyantha]|uniref:transcription factor bHLH51-like n=1 Tax=Oryza brachyantha TaxID=4533 RepID=UPI001ADC799E|nr:transcription factor bHLH51-like [Oryza brachyantha]
MATCQQQPWQEGNQQQQQLLHHGGYGHGLPSVYRGTVVLPRRPGSLALPPPPPPPSSSGRSATDQATALRIHSEAERRRRERINAHLATLRRILPDAKQMDKASLLASAVNQVRELKKSATEVAAPVPPEANEVTVQCYAGDGEHACTYVHATVSCDDRPGLLADIAGALRRLRLRPLRADMSCLGGRTQHAFVLRSEEEGAAPAAGEARSLKEGVRQALAMAAFPEMVYSSSSRSKRQRRMLESRYSTVLYSHGC